VPFLRALEVVYDDALYKSTFTLRYFTVKKKKLKELKDSDISKTKAIRHRDVGRAN